MSACLEPAGTPDARQQVETQVRCYVGSQKEAELLSSIVRGLTESAHGPHHVFSSRRCFKSPATSEKFRTAPIGATLET